MKYNHEYGQFVSSTSMLGVRAIRHYEGIVGTLKDIRINAGNIMVYSNGEQKIIFEVLNDVSVKDLKDTSLIYYAPGSVVALRGAKVLPTLKFKNIRFPFESELEFYAKCYTI